MDRPVHRRNYRLTGSNPGPEFAPGDWYKTPLTRRRLKALMRRSDRAGLIHYGLWLAAVAATGTALILSWGTAWAFPAALCYGIFYGSGSESRWHECAHGTFFKTRWLNDLGYHLAAFMTFKNPYLWRWSHARHHTHTLIVGRDPEIAFPRPTRLIGLILNMTSIKEMVKTLRLSIGRLTADERDFLAKTEHAKTVWAARAHLVIHIGIIAIALIQQSWLPVMLIGLPALYGSWLHHLLATTQHAGLAENVPDHRLNCRTVIMNPVLRFVYTNMNYHLEHHMYPMVPFHALPALHDAIKTDCSPAYPSTLAALRELLPTLWRQRRDPNHCVMRKLPNGANPTTNPPATIT